MDSNKYLELINQMFDESSPPSEEKVFGLMEETISFFKDIKKKLESKDPKEKEAALQETLALKEVLESKMLALSSKLGIDPAQIAALTGQANLAPNQLHAIDEVKGKLFPAHATDKTHTNPLNDKVKYV